MKDLGIKVDTFMSFELFVSEQSNSFSSHVVVREEESGELLANLNKISSSPRIYVIVKDSNKVQQSTGSVTYITSYEELMEKLKKRQLRTTMSLKKEFIDVKILKNIQT